MSAGSAMLGAKSLVIFQTIFLIILLWSVSLSNAGFYDCLVPYDKRHQASTRLSSWKHYDGDMRRRSMLALSKKSSLTLQLSSSREEDEINAIEKQVIASAKARMDVGRLLKVLDREPMDDDISRSNALAKPDDLMSATSPWKIALAASSISSIVSYFVFSNFMVTIFVFTITFIIALDPMNSDDNIIGSLARIVGRTTLKSVNDVQPKIKALARAVVTEEEEITMLTTKIRQLEEEVASLRYWKETREKVDSLSSEFTLKYVKELAKENNIPTSGTKNDIIRRLVEEQLIGM